MSASARRVAALAVILLLAGLAGHPAAGQVRLVGDRFVTAGERPVALAWANGLRDPADLPRYALAGFNTVNVAWPPPPGVSEQEQATLARAATARGLHLLLTLNPLEAVSPERPVDPANAPLVERSVQWLAEATDRWAAADGLVAYALQDQLEERLTGSVPGYAAWLRKHYQHDLVQLLTTWGATSGDWGPLAAADPATIDAARPGGYGPAQRDWALWQVETVSDLLRLWSAVIAMRDPQHAVIGGLMSRPRTLLVAPPVLGGLQPAALASFGYQDRHGHEAGLVAVANQAGRFAALPCLDSSADPLSLWRWVRLACGRGAAGVSFARWADFDAARLDRVQRALSEVRRLELASFRPQPTAAVVLTPLLRGPLVGGRAVWGYSLFGGDEPAGLLDLLRRGTRCGPLGVLAPRDLTRVDLSAYGCLFLPAALTLDAPQVTALRRYVEGGGLLLGDLGAGAAEARLDRLPADLAAAFGLQIVAVRRIGDVVLDRRQRAWLDRLEPGSEAFPGIDSAVSRPGSLVFDTRSALFPELVPTIYTPPRMASSLLTAPGAFTRPAAPATRLIATQASLAGARLGDQATCGLTVHALRAGAAAWWGTFAWQDWRPGDLSFELVHRGLLEQRPQLVGTHSTELCDDDWYLARRDETLWLHRIADTPATASVSVPSLEGRLWPGGLNVVQRARPIDAGSPSQLPPPPLLVQRLLDLAGGELRVETTCPVTLWPSHGSVGADILLYTRDRLELRLFGDGSRAAVRPADGRWQVLDPTPNDAPLIIGDGAYRITPGSLHRLEMWVFAAAASPELGPGVGTRRVLDTLTADSAGRLVIRRAWEDERLSLTPVRDPQGAATP
ncbi:MAG: hypothetical protein IT204_01395 [Fimbriimonadaceae bacterium]|nr:hypothetical protein [Fimbriimonadaceae bacterium]